MHYLDLPMTISHQAKKHANVNLLKTEWILRSLKPTYLTTVMPLSLLLLQLLPQEFLF